MPFHFFIKPNATGNPFSATADLQATVEEDAFLDDVTARAKATLPAIDRPIVEAVIRAMWAAIIAAARDTRPIAAILGLFRMRPTVGGSYPTATPDDSLVRENTDFHLTPLPVVKDQFRDALPMSKSGEIGVAAPAIVSVTVLPTGQTNSYHPGGGLEVRGTHMRSDSPATLPTARLLNLDGTLAVALVVFDSSDRRAVISVPAGTLTGNKLLEYSNTPGDPAHTVRYNIPLALV